MMRKILIGVWIAVLFSSGIAQAYTPVVTTAGNNFTMLDPTGNMVGGANDVIFTWDGTYRNSLVTDGTNNATLSSLTPFFGLPWFAHHVNVYGPGTYTFNTAAAAGNPSGTSSNMFILNVPANMVGAHMLFQYGATDNIDVVVLWDMNKSWAAIAGGAPFSSGGSNTASTVWNGVSIDTPDSTIPAGTVFGGPQDETNTYPGTKMIDGAFPGFSANFNVSGISSATPVVSSNNPTGTPGTLSVVEVVFNKAMDPATLTLASFTVVPTAGGGSVCGGAIAASVGNTTFKCTPTALAFNTSYTVTITTVAKSAAGFPLASNFTWSFTTSNSGATLSLPVTNSFGTATVSIPGGGNLASVGLVAASTINAIPPGVSFNEGLLNYKITGVAPGGTLLVTIDFPASIVGKTLYKIDSTAATPVYTAIPEAAFTRNVNGTTITMNVTDCTAAPCTGYDTNPVGGTIEDPIGAGTPIVIAAVPVVAAAGGGGGCSVDPSGKDVSVLAALLASLGYVGWRRRRRS